MEVTLAADPTPSLDALGRLHDGLGRPGGLIDAMIAVACDSMRDDMFLVYALEGRLTPERTEAWLTEPPRGARLVADGLRGERLRFGAPLGQDLASGGSVGAHLGGQWDGGDIDGIADIWFCRIRPWAHGAADCATHLEVMLALERHMRGDVERAALDAHLVAHEDLGYPFPLMMPNADGMLHTARACDARHRFARLALALVLESTAREATPSCASQAWSWVRRRYPHLHPESLENPMRYVRLGPDCFRLCLETDDARPDLDRRLKEPAADRPLSLHHDLIEVRLP